MLKTMLMGSVVAFVGWIWLKRRKLVNPSKRFMTGLPFNHRVMSHRGGSQEFVENTMPAFRHSVKLKVDLLELDVQETRDGQIVIFHDNSMLRMCGIKNRIQDFDFLDLPPLQVPLHLQTCPDVVNNPESTKIPLLENLLEEFPFYPMQIDVKNGSSNLIHKVNELLVKLKREKITLWGSFKSGPSNLCYKTNPNIPLFFSFKRALYCKLMYHLGLLDSIKMYETCLITPNIFLSKSWIQQLERRGVSVIVFTLNSKDLWSKVWNVGVSGICTDRPTALMEWFRKQDKNK